jgi:hypothetical protein
MNPAEMPQMLPRTVARQTVLVQDGRCPATILYPGQHPGYAEQAEALAAAIARRCGARPAVVADTAVIPARSTPLSDSYRGQPLILLGNLNTNRAIAPLYARDYCATDATYPGGDGYDLRTLVNPYGKGANIILAGGSTRRGVERAVARLIAQVEEKGRLGELTLPFLLDVDLLPSLAEQMAAWPETPLHGSLTTSHYVQMQKVSQAGKMSAIGVPIPETIYDLLGAMGSYGEMYAWTGDERYALFARDCLRALNDQVQDTYGDWHYRIERIVRALPWLCAGGFLDEAEILRSEQLLLGTTITTQNNWWRKHDGSYPLGQRHQVRGTYSFYHQARYLREQANPNEAARLLCDRWLAECRTYLDAVAQACTEDEDHDATLHSVATLFWYGLGEERYEFFESGNARLAAEHALAWHDNMGAAAGVSGYAEGMPGSMYLPFEAKTAVAGCAFYYQDGRYRGILERMPHLMTPLRVDTWSCSPVFMHKLDTGPELIPQEPVGFTGLRVLPLLPYHYELCAHPPEYIEYLGHSVDGPETWLRAVGIGDVTLPRERGFHRVVLRSRFDPAATFLLLQGYQGSWRWQGQMHGANGIVRFSQAGHIFLIQNTDRQSYYHKNAVLVSDGYNDVLLPPFAELRAADDFPHLGLSATRVDPYHRTQWDRHLFWSKAGDGFFLVMDILRPQADGPRTFTCTWRTPGYAAWDGRTWTARQGEHLFTLRASEPLHASNEEERDMGAASPYVLRQQREGDFKKGDCLSFQNLFYVRPQAAPEQLDIRRLDTTAALVVKGDGTPLAWCGADVQEQEADNLGLRIKAASAWVTSTEITLAGATALAMEGAPGWRFESEQPIGLHLDLAAAKITVQIDGPAAEPVMLRLTLDGTPASLVVHRESASTLALPMAGCHQLSGLLRDKLARLAAAERHDEAAAPEPSLPSAGWRSLQTVDSGTRLPERIREVTVAATPAPLDGFAEQLVDTMLPMIRDSRRQWPESAAYEITATFPEKRAVEHLRIVGDSYEQATLRSFHPLPAGITVALSDDGFRQDVRPFLPNATTGILHHQRYFGQADRLLTQDVILNQAARQIRLHVPAPAAGEPLILHELEIYGPARVAPPVRRLLSADLDGDGHWAAVVVNAADELIVLAADGKECWRRQLPSPVNHISCHDLDGTGHLTICLGTENGNILLVSPDGTLRQTIPLAAECRKRNDIFSGMVYSANGLGVWYRGPDGRTALVAGAYAVNVFLDPDGRILGHSWADGSFQTDLLGCPPEGPGPKEVWVRNRWSHGITVYEGREGFASCGESISFGGARQAMFRPLRKVIPFVTGHSVAFRWLAGNDGEGGRILAAADVSVGVLSFAKRDWLWKIEGGAPITACLASDQDGQQEIITGGGDGFIAAFAQADGRPRRRLRVSAPVVGLVPLPAAGILAVATRQGVLALDADWRVVGSWPVAARRICLMGADTILVARDDHALELLRWEGKNGHAL